ncbi:hypothetical protein ABIE38_002619 [Dietzia sp. 2505]|uniref:excalibur calcium-binding domain-containing protein n=1 Tax=Dietzia sp. 2505 TaxID=3156457 RepID=UPI00339628DD
MNARPLVALGLATAALLFGAPAASAAEIHVGPWVVEVPDIAPVVVPVPMGSEAAPLPALPFPFVWATPFVPPAPAPAPAAAPAPAPVHVAPAPAPAPAPVRVQPPAPAPVRHVANCTEARQLGVAPIYRGDPLYRPALDRDNDGIACE